MSLRIEAVFQAVLVFHGQGNIPVVIVFKYFACKLLLLQLCLCFVANRQAGAGICLREGQQRQEHYEQQQLFHFSPMQ